MSWHVDVETLTRYQAGSIDRVAATSVEAHVTDCAECRSSVVVEDQWLDRSWTRIADRVEPSRPALVERLLTRAGVPTHWARLAAASPTLRVSFIIAVALVIGFAAVASGSTPDGGSYRVFLAIAPVVPVMGVAFAYGRLVDPAFELTMSAPIDSLRLLLLRASIVLLVSILFGAAAWPFVPVPG
ncbi:MAG: zf-HC2 domain-containing protein, partial [Acidimicrobiia bacterium]